MEEFFNILNDYILILDKDFKFKFCNDKFLREIDEDKNDIHKFIFDISTEEELLINLKDNDRYTTILKGFINEKYIKLHNSKIIKHSKDEEVIYYVSGDKLDKLNFELCYGDTYKKIEKVIDDAQYYIELLEEIKSKLKLNYTIEESVKGIDLERFITGTIDEIRKGELMKKDLEIFLNLSTDLTGCLDREGNLVVANESWYKILGWDLEELLNNNILDLIHSSYKSDFSKSLNNISAVATTTENKIKCKNGRYKWLRWNMKLIKEINFIAVTVKDISIERKEEKRIIKLKQEIEAENLKNQFFANLSHEFKTPLNIILGTTQLLDMNINKENIYSKDGFELEKYVNLIRQNSYRILKLVNNLIDMSKIDAGYYKLELKNHNIVNIVEDISLSVAEYAKGNGLDLVFDTDCEELVIACDPDKIERILLNLLSNSIKNTAAGGNIFINLYSGIDKVNISVKDTGNGIPQEKLATIFNRFEQVDNLLNRNYEGSGIGLSLVESLVKMHGGSISVSSELGVGSKFEFDIPNNLLNNCDLEGCSYRENDNRVEKCNIEFSDIYNWN